MTPEPIKVFQFPRMFAIPNLTPIESPIRDFLCAKPDVMAYAEGMRARFFPELLAAGRPASRNAVLSAAAAL